MRTMAPGGRGGCSGSGAEGPRRPPSAKTCLSLAQLPILYLLHLQSDIFKRSFTVNRLQCCFPWRLMVQTGRKDLRWELAICTPLESEAGRECPMSQEHGILETTKRCPSQCPTLQPPGHWHVCTWGSSCYLAATVPDHSSPPHPLPPHRSPWGPPNSLEEGWGKVDRVVLVCSLFWFVATLRSGGRLSRDSGEILSCYKQEQACVSGR